MSFGADTTGGGLLDFIKTPEGMGLLSAVAGGLSGAKRGTPFNNIGRGLLAGISGYGSGLEMQKAAQEQARQQAEREAMQNAYKALLGQSDVTQPSMQKPDAAQPIDYSITQPQNNIPAQQTSNTVQAPQAAQNPYLKMLASGVPLDKVKGIYEASNIGRPKIKNIETISLNGAPTKVGIDEYGQQVAQIGTEWKPLQIQDFGGYVGGIDVTNPNAPVKSFGQKTLAPGESQRIAIEQQRLQLAKQAQAFDQGLAPDQGMPMSGGMSVNPPQISGGAALPGGPLPTGMLGGAQSQASGMQQVPNQALLSKRLGKPPEGKFWADAQGNTIDIPGGNKKQNEAQRVSVKDATDALYIIDEAQKLLPKATGSPVGAGLDVALKTFGYATDGYSTTNKLKTLEALLISKMPKMSGPQSDKDVALYRQMAGNIGDPMTPVKVRQDALETLKTIQQKYAGIGEQDIQQMQPKQQPASMPMKGQVVDGYKFNGGNPADPKNWSKQ